MDILDEAKSAISPRDDLFLRRGGRKRYRSSHGVVEKSYANGNVDAAYRLSEISTSTKTTF